MEGGDLSIVSVCVASGLFLYFAKLAQFSEKVGFAWGPAFGSMGSGRFHRSCRDNRAERTRPDAIECYIASEVDVGKSNEIQLETV